MKTKNEKLRIALLNAGKNEFLAHGYRSVSIRNIAAKAGATTGAIYVYFENTAELDAGNLPLQAQAELAVNIQTYLERSGYGDVTELYINNYTEDGQNITIQCNMDGYADELLIEYDGEEKHLSYCIVKN